VSGHFERAVGRSGVRVIRFHDVRHTHATLLLEAGVDISVVSRRIGHGDVGFTAKVYAHVTARLQLDAAAKLSTYLEPLAVVG
jgi:integrase